MGGGGWEHYQAAGWGKAEEVIGTIGFRRLGRLILRQSAAFGSHRAGPQGQATHSVLASHGDRPLQKQAAKGDPQPQISLR